MASIVVIALVLILDVLAFVLAIGAEHRRSTVGQPILFSAHQPAQASSFIQVGIRS